MARNSIADEFYAGWIEWDNGTVQTFGPYNSAGTAKGQITAELRYTGLRKAVKTGIKKGVVSWTEIDPVAEKKRAAAEKREAAKRAKQDAIDAAKQGFWEEFNA